MVITENGFGAHESKDAEGKIHDRYRIDFLRNTIYQLGLAIEAYFWYQRLIRSNGEDWGKDMGTYQK